MKQGRTSNEPGNASTLTGDTSMLEDLFLDQLKDIYWAEKHLVQMLPQMYEAATTQKLREAINEHFEQTKTHVSRLEGIFKTLNKTAQARKCDAMAGITAEGDDIVNATEKGSVTRDVGIILAAQKIEHYEIATYGGLAQIARTLNLAEVADILAKTLQEEKTADERLTFIAENSINVQAAGEELE